MKNNMSSLERFIHKFGYIPNHPQELFFNENEYADLLDKCVNDNFDYTIEKYGTDPTYGTQPHDGIYID